MAADGRVLIDASIAADVDDRAAADVHELTPAQQANRQAFQALMSFTDELMEKQFAISLKINAQRMKQFLHGGK